jgi:hypothetical protein
MKGPYDDRIQELQKELNYRNILIIIQALTLLIYVGLAIFLGISFIVHWVSNDSLTFIQIIKWSIKSYWWAYIYIIVVHLFKSEIKDNVNRRERCIMNINIAEKKNKEYKQNLYDQGIFPDNKPSNRGSYGR